MKPTYGEITNCPMIPPEARIWGNCQWCGKELTGRKRKWCSEECDTEFFKHHSWNTARIYAHRPKCEMCCEPGWKEIHHIKPLNGKYADFTCQHHQENLICVCKRCHMEEHKRLRNEHQPRGEG